MKKKILLLMGIFTIGFIHAQVGINTQNPQGMLHIKSAGSTDATKALSAINNSNKEVLTILDNGNVGLGVTSPKIAIDLRDNTDGAILGIGGSTQAASVAGVGAVKYEDTYGTLLVSNGTSWDALQSSIQKVTVLAEIQSSAQVFLADGIGVAISGWTKISDSFNSFNAAAGKFTAPHNGLYTIAVMLNFNPATVNNNSNVELKLLTSTGLAIAGVTTYPMAGMCSVYTRCSSSISLLKNQTITILIANNLGSNISLISNREYNKLSITES